MQDIKSIANKIKQAGGNLYLVGGAVRDELLGKPTHDEDYCVTGITSEKFQELFPEAHVRGKAFAVFDIDGNEFAMARTESKQGIGHKEFEINTNPQITIEQDLARRDITINAIAKDVLTQEIIDPFNGKRDLENKIIKATTEHFKEDPLRVYRVARFATQLGFEVENETIEQMIKLNGILSEETIIEKLGYDYETEKARKEDDLLNGEETHNLDEDGQDGKPTEEENDNDSGDRDSKLNKGIEIGKKESDSDKNRKTRSSEV